MTSTTLLLVHGIGSTRAFWDPIVPLLEGFTSVAVDVPGFGAAPAIEEPVTVARLAAALDTALDEPSPGPVVVIGHSLGGMIAEELALLAPERVRGLVLCNTIPGVTEGAREFNPVLADLAETAGSAAVADALLPAMLGPKPLENTDRARERFLADMRSADPASLSVPARTTRPSSVSSASCSPRRYRPGFAPAGADASVTSTVRGTCLARKAVRRNARPR